MVCHFYNRRPGGSVLRPALSVPACHYYYYYCYYSRFLRFADAGSPAVCRLDYPYVLVHSVSAPYSVIPVRRQTASAFDSAFDSVFDSALLHFSLNHFVQPHSVLPLVLPFPELTVQPEHSAVQGFSVPVQQRSFAAAVLPVWQSAALLPVFEAAWAVSARRAFCCFEDCLQK